jgi:septum site-determining protein MinC
LILPTPGDKDTASDWSTICQEIKYYLKHGDRTWQSQTPIHLIAQDRLLDCRQLQQIAQALGEVELELKYIHTSRRQTAVAAAMAGYSVQQEALTPSWTAPAAQKKSPLQPLYLKTPVRSGIEVRHPGTIIILGDINPGGSAVADGDILVWGHLRGMAHAGAQGNRESRIMALRIEAAQLRIADALARVEDPEPEDFQPEVAYLTGEGIRIAPAINFDKTHTFVLEIASWIDKPSELAKMEKTPDRNFFERILG